jgi:hypothetical protein
VAFEILTSNQCGIFAFPSLNNLRILGEVGSRTAPPFEAGSAPSGARMFIGPILSRQPIRRFGNEARICGFAA